MPLYSTSFPDRKKTQATFLWLTPFHLLSSVFPSGFSIILDFFLAFLSLISIFICSVRYFTLVSRSFWTFFLLFFALCPFSPAQFSISLQLRVHFGLFPAFLGLMSIRKSTEDCGLRKAALRRKRLTIIYRQEKFISQNNSNLPRIQNPESRIWNPECGITPFLFQKLLFRLP